jgi:glycosyltransferase involved in cell wall biosynthesis
MRILLLTQYFPPEVGAAQGRLGAVVRELVRAGQQVEVVTAMPNYPTGRIADGYRWRFYVRESREGVAVHRLWLYPAVGAGAARLLNYASFSLTAFLGLLRATRPDYLFVESPPLSLGVTAVVAARLWSVPFIFNVADLWPDVVRELGVLSDGYLLRAAERLERWIYRRAAYITTITDGIRTALVTQKGVPAQKVLFLPNAVDTETFRPAPPDEALARRLGLTGKKVIVYAGTHGYAHALESVLDAARLLVSDPDLRFLFVGDGSEKAKLVARARSLGLTNVTFMDPVPAEEIPALLSLSFCGLVSQRDLPLFLSARSVKAFSVMACAKPVVFAGRGEGAREIVESGSGVVVPPEDPAALASAIRRLAASPEKARELGLRGRAHAEKNLAWATHVRAWLASIAPRPVRGQDAAGPASIA